MFVAFLGILIEEQSLFHVSVMYIIIRYDICIYIYI